MNKPHFLANSLASLFEREIASLNPAKLIKGQRLISSGMSGGIVSWHGRQDLNLQPTVLETATLPLSYARIFQNVILNPPTGG